jgi:hypothetical protein
MSATIGTSLLICTQNQFISPSQTKTILFLNRIAKQLFVCLFIANTTQDIFQLSGATVILHQLRMGS